MEARRNLDSVHGAKPVSSALLSLSLNRSTAFIAERSATRVDPYGKRPTECAVEIERAAGHDGLNATNEIEVDEAVCRASA